MRTTVTLDPDVHAFLVRVMADKDLTFKQALNDAVRAGIMAASTRQRISPSTFDMGEPFVDLTKALHVAGQLEDAELASRLTRGA